MYGKEAAIDENLKHFEKIVDLSEFDIRGVICALENVAHHLLSQGHIFRLDKWRNLYPAISSNGALEESALSANSIKKAGVNHYSGKRIIAALNSTGFNKINETFQVGAVSPAQP